MAFTKFPHIYQPIQVGSMTMKNHIQFSPIVSNHADAESGRVNHELLDFVSMQAQTGAALVVTQMPGGTVDWMAVGSAVIVAGVASLGTSLAGLPELEKGDKA